MSKLNDTLRLKLATLLKTRRLFKTEKDVIYFFVLIRKLLDLNNSYTEYQLLRFYADWTIHTNKSRNIKVILPILSKIDTVSVKYSNTEFDPYYDFMDFNALKDEVIKFLRENAINKNFDEMLLFDLQISLSSILHEQPLDCSNIKETGIKSIVFTMENDEIMMIVYFKEQYKLPQRVYIML